MQTWAEVLEVSFTFPGSCPCGARFDESTVSHKRNIQRSFVRHGSKCAHALLHVLMKLQEGGAYTTLQSLPMTGIALVDQSLTIL